MSEWWMGLLTEWFRLIDDWMLMIALFSSGFYFGYFARLMKEPNYKKVEEKKFKN
jgi:hypothetical protein